MSVYVKQTPTLGVCRTCFADVCVSTVYNLLIAHSRFAEVGRLEKHGFFM